MTAAEGNIPASELLTVRQAAIRSSGVLSEAGIRWRLGAGSLRFVNIDGRVFIPAAALDELVKKLGVK